MTNTPFTEPSPDAIIRGLHEIREAIVESFQGDLHSLTEDARKRERKSGRKFWRPVASSDVGPSSKDVSIRSDQ